MSQAHLDFIEATYKLGMEEEFSSQPLDALLNFDRAAILALPDTLEGFDHHDWDGVTWHNGLADVPHDKHQPFEHCGITFVPADDGEMAVYWTFRERLQFPPCGPVPNTGSDAKES